MENDEKYIDTRPNAQDIEEILNWIKDDLKPNGDGFYNNENIIKSSFEKGELIVFKQEKKNIGLAIWTNRVDGLLVDIDIFVIHPAYRRQGLGGFYYNEILELFRNKGIKIIKLFCAPSESESFWRKMGLIKFPECIHTEHKLTYYMVLVDIASSKNISMANKIELWDVEPDEADKKKPKWTWYVEMKNGVLKYPIIQPCDCNWYLRWSRNNRVLKGGKVKYFTNENFGLYRSSFLYIYELKE